jgi:hypothetical protein
MLIAAGYFLMAGAAVGCGARSGIGLRALVLFFGKINCRTPTQRQQRERDPQVARPALEPWWQELDARPQLG